MHIPNKPAPKRHAKTIDPVIVELIAARQVTPAAAIDSSESMKGSPPDAVNTLVVTAASRIALEGDSSSDLRAVHNSFETEIVFLEVTAESPVTNLSKDGTSQVNANHGLDLPHQVGANSEPSDFAANRS